MAGKDSDIASDGARVTARSHATPPEGYLALSQRPLHVLVFLTPLLIAYEYGAVRYLGGGSEDAQTIAAWGMLARVFENFGVVGYHLPGVLLVTVLVIWHLLLRDPWTVRVPVLVGMAMEACLWTVPLTILAMLFTPVAGAVQTETPGADLMELSLGARLTISFGAGLYEELLFRMIVIAAAHALLVDVMRLPNALGAVLAVLVSAVAFAVYHKSPDLTAMDSAFYGLAGVYFGTLYLTRGFGLVVTVHTLYDVLVLVVVGQQTG